MMSSKHLRGDKNYAWPTAEIAVMGVNTDCFNCFAIDLVRLLVPLKSFSVVRMLKNMNKNTENSLQLLIRLQEEDLSMTSSFRKLLGKSFVKTWM